MTAPDHFLGDYPAVKWRRFADAIKAYEEALKLQPSNAEVLAALKRARAGQP